MDSLGKFKGGQMTKHLPKSSLPEWVDSERMCDCDGCDYQIKIQSALSLAWEALEVLRQYRGGPATITKGAMDAIRKLGDKP